MTLLALAAPRLVVAVLWFFTHWFRGVFDTMLWPLLGFFLAPFTLLWYSAVHNWFGGVWGPWQIAGSSHIPLGEMVKIDYLYVANWSLWNDIKILLRTVPCVLARRGQ